MAQKLWTYVKISDLTYEYIWHLTLKDDIDLTTSSLKMSGFMKYICILNMEAIRWRMKKLEQLSQKVNLLTYSFFLTFYLGGWNWP